MSTLQASAQAQLRQFVEQIERLEEEKKAIAADIRDKFAEAKGVGFDVKAMRKILQLRKKTAVERQEEEGVLEVYMHALGMLSELVDDDAAGSYVEAAESGGRPCSTGMITSVGPASPTRLCLPDFRCPCWIIL